MVKENTMQQTEIGLIPEDWEVKTLGGIGKFTKGKGISKSEANTGEIPAIRYGELYTKHHNVVKKYYSFISESVAENSIELKRGDILFAGSGETKEEIGKSIAFIDDFRTCVGGDIVILRPTQDTDSSFLGYLLNSKAIQRQKSANGQGDAVVHIYASGLYDVKIPLPPLPEQQAIAKALSDADAWIESLEDLIAKKRLIKQGAMQELLTPKEGWEVKKLGEVLNKTPDYGINAAAVSFNDKFPTYLRITDIGDNGEFLYQTKVSVDSILSPNYILDTGDICIARTGASVGKSYYHQQKNGMLVFAGFLIRLKVNSEILNSKLLFYITKSHAYYDFINSNSMRSGQPGINSLELQSFEISFPKSLTEQTRIATILSDMDTEIEQLEQKLTKARQIKQGMMQELLTGRVRLV